MVGQIGTEKDPTVLSRREPSANNHPDHLVFHHCLRLSKVAILLSAVSGRSSGGVTTMIGG